MTKHRPGRPGQSKKVNEEHSTIWAHDDYREVFPLPEHLILRTRTSPNRQDQKAEALVRELITELGKDPDRVLTIVKWASWPKSEDAPGFTYPQLVVEGVYWQGLPAIQRYVEAMRPQTTKMKRE